MKRFAALICMMLALAISVGCCAEGLANNEPEVNEIIKPAKDSNEVLVETKHVSFSFLGTSEDCYSINVNEIDEGTIIEVSVLMDETVISLYTVAVVSEEMMDGIRVGTLKAENAGELSVILYMNEYNAEEWDDDEFAKICELQETVNEFFAQLQENPRFAEAEETSLT